MLRVMKKVFGKYNIANPSGFTQKLRIMKQKEKAAFLKRSDSAGTNAQKSERDWSETGISKTKGSSRDGLSRDGDGDSSKGGGGKSDNNSDRERDEDQDHENEGE